MAMETTTPLSMLINLYVRIYHKGDEGKEESVGEGGKRKSNRKEERVHTNIHTYVHMYVQPRSQHKCGFFLQYIWPGVL